MTAWTPPPLVIFTALCTVCRHGEVCDRYRPGESANSGMTCLAYDPKPMRNPLTPDHVLALPDRDPCSTCASRKGTEANGTHHTMVDFRTSVERLEPFLCHGDGHDRICGGWLRAAKAAAREKR